MTSNTVFRLLAIILSANMSYDETSCNIYVTFLHLGYPYRKVKVSTNQQQQQQQHSQGLRQRTQFSDFLQSFFLLTCLTKRLAVTFCIAIFATRILLQEYRSFVSPSATTTVSLSRLLAKDLVFRLLIIVLSAHTSYNETSRNFTYYYFATMVPLQEPRSFQLVTTPTATTTTS